MTVAVHSPPTHFVLDAYNCHSVLIAVRIAFQGPAKLGHSGVMGSRAALLCFPVIGLLVIGCSSDTRSPAPAADPRAHAGS